MPHGPPELPILGQTWRYLTNRIGQMQEAAAYGETMIHYALRHQQRWTDGMEVDMVPEMRDLTLHIVVKALFGIDCLKMSRALARYSISATST